MQGLVAVQAADAAAQRGLWVRVTKAPRRALSRLLSACGAGICRPAISLCTACLAMPSNWRCSAVLSSVEQEGAITHHALAVPGGVAGVVAL